MTDKPLQPGEIRLAPYSINGYRPYVRVLADGREVRGTTVTVDHPSFEHADCVLEVGPESDRPGVHTVTRDIRYTARGPSQVSSDAYRNGWDAVFGTSMRGGDGCNSSKAN